MLRSLQLAARTFQRRALSTCVDVRATPASKCTYWDFALLRLAQGVAAVCRFALHACSALIRYSRRFRTQPRRSFHRLPTVQLLVSRACAGGRLSELLKARFGATANRGLGRLSARFRRSLSGFASLLASSLLRAVLATRGHVFARVCCSGRDRDSLPTDCWRARISSSVAGCSFASSDCAARASSARAMMRRGASGLGCSAVVLIRTTKQSDRWSRSARDTGLIFCIRLCAALRVVICGLRRIARMLSIMANLAFVNTCSERGELATRASKTQSNEIAKNTNCSWCERR